MGLPDTQTEGRQTLWAVTYHLGEPAITRSTAQYWSLFYAKDREDAQVKAYEVVKKEQKVYKQQIWVEEIKEMPGGFNIHIAYYPGSIDTPTA